MCVCVCVCACMCVCVRAYVCQKESVVVCLSRSGSEHAEAFGVSDGLQQSVPQLLLGCVLGQE